MSIVHFDYTFFRDHYKGLGSVTHDVVVRLYTADYKAMKLAQKKGAASADMSASTFIHKGMTVKMLPEDDPLMRLPIFRFGAYVVHPSDERNDEQMFIVFPWEQGDDKLGTYFTADHFSFVVNPSAGVGRR
jgi:hypothetical protein